MKPVRREAGGRWSLYLQYLRSQPNLQRHESESYRVYGEIKGRCFFVEA